MEEQNENTQQTLNIENMPCTCVTILYSSNYQRVYSTNRNTNKKLAWK